MTALCVTPSIRWTAAALAAVLLAACAKKEPPAASAPAAAKPAVAPLATVDGVNISRGEFDFYVKQLTNGKPMQLSPEQQSQVLDELVSMQLMAAQGAKHGLETDADVAARLDVTRMRLLADAESQNYLKAKESTDAELRAEYDKAVGELDKTEYHARHILVPSKEQAIELIRKIRAGAKFEDVAKANSVDTGSKADGGDLKWFSLNNMVKPFGDAVKSLKKGEMTSIPVQTQFGWHVIKLEDIRETSPPPFDQVKARIANRVMQKKLQAYVEDLKKNAKITRQPIEQPPAAAEQKPAADQQPPAGAPASAGEPAAPAKQP